MENETSFLWGCQKQTRSRLTIHRQSKVDYNIHTKKMGRVTGPQAPASPAWWWLWAGRQPEDIGENVALEVLAPPRTCCMDI